MARIYINRHIIAANQKTGDRNPPISVLHNGRRVYSTSTVELRGTARVIYSPDKPLKNGARVWIECDEPHCRLVKPRPTTPA